MCGQADAYASARKRIGMPTVGGVSRRGVVVDDSCPAGFAVRISGHLAAAH